MARQAERTLQEDIFTRETRAPPPPSKNGNVSYVSKVSLQFKSECRSSGSKKILTLNKTEDAGRVLQIGRYLKVKQLNLLLYPSAYPFLHSLCLFILQFSGWQTSSNPLSLNPVLAIEQKRIPDNLPQQSLENHKKWPNRPKE